MSKIRYQIELTGVSRSVGYDERIRPVTSGDAAGLASLMLDAYRDTIDYDGEDLSDAVVEIDSYFNDGRPLVDLSRVVVDDNVIVAGILVSEIDDGPFIAYVMTRAAHKSNGLATLVTKHALAAMAEAGHEKVVFYITAGNEPSERLFRSLGAEAAV